MPIPRTSVCVVSNFRLDIYFPVRFVPPISTPLLLIVAPDHPGQYGDGSNKLHFCHTEGISETSFTPGISLRSAYDAKDAPDVWC